jgi:hypothetical protein
MLQDELGKQDIDPESLGAGSFLGLISWKVILQL